MSQLMLRSSQKPIHSRHGVSYPTALTHITTALRKTYTKGIRSKLRKTWMIV